MPEFNGKHTTFNHIEQPWARRTHVVIRIAMGYADKIATTVGAFD